MTFDVPGNGFIEGEELDAFLTEFVSSANLDHEEVEVSQLIYLVLQTTKNSLLQISKESLAELKQCFMEAYDDNEDGKIDIREVR